jgi:transcriptional regulator with XRE-family HTH domain
MPSDAKPKFKQVALKITSRLRERSLTIDKLYDLLNEQTNISYEQVRRVTKGLSNPSKSLLKEIANVLDLDEHELERLHVIDQARKRYGKMLAVICQKNPELEPVELVWPFLSVDQKKSIVTTAEAYAQANASRAEM